MRRLSFGLVAILACTASYSIGTNRASAQEAAHQHAETEQAQRGHSDRTGMSDAILKTVGAHKVKTILQDRGIMVRVMTTEGRAVDASRGSGTLNLRVGENPKEYRYTLKPLKDGMLGTEVDLSKVKGHMLHVNIVIEGVGSTPIEFHVMGKVASDRLSDELLISLQGTCPVSGQKLGAMGKPPKIELGDKSLFVCCAGCIEKVKASPDHYLSQYYAAPGKEVRPGVFEATLADSQAIARQKVCPVMDEPLGGMGVPGKVNIKGKAVFICCAGCAKKLAAEPDKYLAALKEQGVTPPDFK